MAKKEYNLNEREIEVLIRNKALCDYFEEIVSELKRESIKGDDFYKLIKLCANYLISDYQGLLVNKISLTESKSITPENFAKFINLIYKGDISSKIAKMVLVDMFKTGASPSYIIKEKGNLYLIHSNYLSGKVEIEQIEHSEVFASYTKYYIVEISTNNEFIESWIKKKEIIIIKK